MGVFEIGETDAKEIMRAYNFNVPSECLPRQSRSVRFQIRPVIRCHEDLKPDILHKSDVGGVKVGLESI